MVEGRQRRSGRGSLMERCVPRISWCRSTVAKSAILELLGYSSSMFDEWNRLPQCHRHFAMLFARWPDGDFHVLTECG